MKPCRRYVTTVRGRVYCGRAQHPPDLACWFKIREFPVPRGWRTGHRVPQHMYYNDTPIVTLPAPVTYALVRFLNWCRPGT